MYAQFFGLAELPFNNTPDPRFFYSTPDHEEAVASVVYAIRQRKGFVVLTGEVGAGKTLVTRLVLRQIGPEISFATINHAIRDGSDLLESVCTEFELPVQPGMSHSQLVRMLHDFLLSKFAANVPVVLVLDEAQNLPVPAFEELRMIGNLEADAAKLLQIAIVGQPELQQMFHSAQLRQLQQRVFRSFHLGPLDRRQTEGYIRYRLSVAAASDTRIFSQEAVDLVYEYSKGLPRLINTVCDNAMLAAYSVNARWIDREIVGSILKEGQGLQGVSTIATDPTASGGVLAIPTREAPPFAISRGNPMSQSFSERLEEAIHKAEVLLERLRQSETELMKRQRTATELVEALRQVGKGLLPMLARLSAAASSAQRASIACSNAETRLEMQNQRAAQLIRNLASLTETTPGGDGAWNTSMTEWEQASATKRQRGVSQGGEFEELLASAQASLAELRGLSSSRSFAASM